MLDKFKCFTGYVQDLNAVKCDQDIYRLLKYK
jgi:hypothetical protein